MYSKEKGFTRPPSGALRSPARPGRVSVPPNYRGHAIVNGEERPLGTLGQDTPSAEDRADLPIPRFDGLPRVSDLGSGSRHPSRSIPATFETAETARPSAAEEAADRVAEYRLLPPPPTPRPTESGEHKGESCPPRFLSGHGLGLEELLLLGLILFLLREGGDEDRGDLDETVILLGLLLLLG